MAIPTPAAYWDLPYTLEDASRSRFLRLHALPKSESESSNGTVVVIHGGYWKNQYGLDDPYGNAGTASLAPFFLSCGFTAVELEYRRRDHEGGGWPGTNLDIMEALRYLCKLHVAATGNACQDEASDPMSGLATSCKDAIRALRLDKLILLGHSAGGCLALWVAHQIAGQEDTSLAPCNVAFVMAMAPVADLVHGYEMRLSDEGDAVEKYMKCAPHDDGALKEYQKASPSALLPLSFAALVAYGDKDTDVPPEHVAKYVAAARETSSEKLTGLLVPEADHFDIVNAQSTAWKQSILPALVTLAGTHMGEDVALALRSSL